MGSLVTFWLDCARRASCAILSVWKVEVSDQMCLESARPIGSPLEIKPAFESAQPIGTFRIPDSTKRTKVCSYPDTGFTWLRV